MIINVLRLNWEIIKNNPFFFFLMNCLFVLIYEFKIIKNYLLDHFICPLENYGVYIKWNPLSIYLPCYLSIFLAIYLFSLLSIYLSCYISIFVAIYLSFLFFSIYLSFLLSIYWEIINQLIIKYTKNWDQEIRRKKA